MKDLKSSNDYSATAYEFCALPDEAQSALPPSEPQGACERSSLAPGSLPVSSVEALLLLWQQNADETTNASYRAGILACIRDLRAVMEAAESSQQRENVKDEPRPL